MRVCSAGFYCVLAAGLVATTVAPLRSGDLFAADDAPYAVKQRQIARGRELFVRQWQPFDSSSREGKPGAKLSGDGLGPVYNDISCAACHSLGGVGGAGPADKNVQILVLRKKHGPAKPDQLHPALSRAVTAAVLHRSSLQPNYSNWRLGRLDLASTDFENPLTAKVLAAGAPSDSASRRFVESAVERLSHDSKTSEEYAVEFAGHMYSAPPLFLTERNPPALFGASLIDAIDGAAIKSAAIEQARDFPQIAGSFVLSTDGRIGRFGWQAQQVSLAEFTLTACAVELGLTVPGHPQASDPRNENDDEPGLDLSQEDSEALVAFVAALAPPQERVPRAQAEQANDGRELFTRIGCAQCHLPYLGGVMGIYSDLLLHNMGYQISGDDQGGYGAFRSNSKITPQPQQQPIRTCVISPAERLRVRSPAVLCRTPPLWGVASSAPYLHDGRAATLSDAISMHAGQGSTAADAFRALAGPQQLSLLAFLNSLVPPDPSDSATNEVSAATSTLRIPLTAESSRR